MDKFVTTDLLGLNISRQLFKLSLKFCFSSNHLINFLIDLLDGADGVCKDIELCFISSSKSLLAFIYIAIGPSVLLQGCFFQYFPISLKRNIALVILITESSPFLGRKRLPSLFIHWIIPENVAFEYILWMTGDCSLRQIDYMFDNFLLVETLI